MATAEGIADEIKPIIRRWSKKRGNLIMMLHDIQDKRGYVPRDVARTLADQVGVPLARIYEVLTFYNYFKLKSPGRAVISVCTGTACHLKGAPELVAALEENLGVKDGESTSDGDFHLQCVRCVGCCGLAPAIVINGQTYGKCRPEQMNGIIGEWRDKLDKLPRLDEEAEA